MSALDDLIKKIPDDDLRNQVRAAVRQLKRDKKFGLVFEEHDEPLGEIYPSLQRLDEVCNAPDSELWHVLIEAENYHALQLLKYVCADRKVDCIYIDPPYNTGARDWKYNNDYVDGTDAYRHSKWLSMMKRRLELAKEILNPADSVLIVTIDEHEYLHLGCLLEEIFPEAHIQMVSIVNNPAGTGRINDFARVNEYIFFVRLGDAKILPEFRYGSEHKSVLWDVFRRSELVNTRRKTKAQFYPIFINDEDGTIQNVGDPLDLAVDISSVVAPKGCTAVFPIRDDGIETSWSCKKEELLIRLSKGYIKVGKKNLAKPQKYSLSYIKTGAIADIESGKAVVEGYNKDGSVRAFYSEKRKKNPPTVLTDDKYNARTYGSSLVDSIVGQRFSYPKSLYAVEDCLRFFVADKPEALIVDFFAGSGTTAHAVNLLNAEDGGNRRCIMITNNEVSDAEEKQLRAKGYTPDDECWQNLGIARYVTWPRTVCSIEGHDINGAPLKGNYLGSDIPMSDGFRANAIFFKLGFLDRDKIALGRRFKEMLPLMWLKAGGHGRCPTVDADQSLPPMMILIENKFAVLLDEKFFMEFERQMLDQPTVETIFIVTDSTDGYISMIQNFRDRKTYQLYRDYLENFRLNTP